jgi:hypothetical protein
VCIPSVTLNIYDRERKKKTAWTEVVEENKTYNLPPKYTVAF